MPVSKKTTVVLPEALLKAAKHAAVEQGVPLSRLLVAALDMYLKTKGGKRA